MPILRALLPVFLACIGTPAATAARSPPAVARLARQFDHHRIVAIGEFHRGRELHAFVQTLLHDPAFICRADDVVVEFGNSRLQARADAYVGGAALSEAELVALWRETAVPLTWNAPMYRQVYEAVRAINARKLCRHPLRVVLADPPLDWSQVRDVEDYKKYTDRDGSMAEVVEREVLARGRRALLLAGKLHVLKRVPPEFQDPTDGPDAVQRIEQRHPGAVFVALPVPTPQAAQVLGLEPPPSFAVVRGTPLAQADFALTYPTWTPADAAAADPAQAKGGGLRIGEVADGLFWFGGEHALYPPATIYLDPDYQRELRRRADIIRRYSGQDFGPAIDALVKEAGGAP